MRGKDEENAVIGSCNGITPAYAGKSIVSHSELSANEDHPRLCGEKAKSHICCVER